MYNGGLLSKITRNFVMSHKLPSMYVMSIEVLASTIHLIIFFGQCKYIIYLYMSLVETPFTAYGKVKLRERVRTCRDWLYCPKRDRPCGTGCGCDRKYRCRDDCDNDRRRHDDDWRGDCADDWRCDDRDRRDDDNWRCYRRCDRSFYVAEY